ncbi:MAG: hypothetical protein WCG26_04145, partial [Chloroflexales bacterium]
MRQRTPAQRRAAPPTNSGRIVPYPDARRKGLRLRAQCCYAEPRQQHARRLKANRTGAACRAPTLMSLRRQASQLRAGGFSPPAGEDTWRLQRPVAAPALTPQPP